MYECPLRLEIQTLGPRAPLPRTTLHAHITTRHPRRSTGSVAEAGAYANNRRAMGLVMSVGTSAASALASCCVGSAASCVCSGLKAIMPSGYTAAKVYALILLFGA